MSAHILLNLLNEFWKIDKMQGVGFIYHMTLKSVSVLRLKYTVCTN